MKILSLFIIHLFCIGINTSPTQGNYPDPDEIRVIDSKIINYCVNFVFTNGELCKSKGKYIQYECWLDTKGNISRIKRKDKNRIDISSRKETELSKILKEKVVFHVPKTLTAKSMEPFRKSFIFIPTKSNCK